MRSVAMNALLVAVVATGVSVQGKPAFELTTSVGGLSQPSKVKGSFVEQFTEDWDSLWNPLEATEKTPVGGEIFGYNDKWAAEESKAPIIEGDLSLVAETKAAHHAISAPFETSLSPVDEPFVVQHGVGYQRNGDCAGGILGRPLPEEEILRRQRGEY